MNEPAQQTILIIGAGQAGGECASELRRQGSAARIVILGDESVPPYKRPPLSKAYLAGTVDEASLQVIQPANFEKNQIEFRGNCRVTAIHRAEKSVSLADGSRMAYDALVLATGGRARPLTLPGADKPNVFALRSLADVQAIRPYCVAGQRLVVIGGGFIGLESAAVAVKMGLKVTVLEGLPRVLARVTVPLVSEFFARAHREAGVDLRTGVEIAALEGDTAVTQVRLADGSCIAADFVVYGIGLIANTELAEAAGLAVDNGIVVDAFTRTADPNILAVGDCTNHPSDFAGRRLRLESVQNAMEQARAAARVLVGKGEAYQIVPWFWSDQYDLKLQMVGFSAGHDQIVLRGDPASQRSFAVFYLREGRMIAADTVSRAADFMFAKKWVAEGARLDPAALADESVALKTLLPLG